MDSVAGGVGIVAASVGLAHLLCRNEKHDSIGLKIGPNFFIYLARLAKEIILSTISVCKAIFLQKKVELQPILAEIPTRQVGDEAKVLFGNSIILTPGTITVDILENSVVVHAISAECLRGVTNLDSKIRESQR